jgi:hypothetical protein
MMGVACSWDRETRIAYRIPVGKSLENASWKTEGDTRATLNLIFGRQIIRMGHGCNWKGTVAIATTVLSSGMQEVYNVS